MSPKKAKKSKKSSAKDELKASKKSEKAPKASKASKKSEKKPAKDESSKNARGLADLSKPGQADATLKASTAQSVLKKDSSGKKGKKDKNAKAIQAEAALHASTPRGYTFEVGLDEYPSVTSLDTRATVGLEGDKAAGQQLLDARVSLLGDLQEKLWAQHFGNEEGRRVLLVVQGMDTSGKGGIMRHVVGAVDPQGVRIKAFKAPTSTEKNRHFLWRIRRALPEPGMIGVFDRSHYEDVLIHKVHGWADQATLEKRYADINRFEKQLVQERGYEIVKVMLHISPEEQWHRLYERLEREDKHWKFNTGDLDERDHWPAYMEAYDAAIRETHTEWAPWHVVPADRKWYARLAVQQLLIDALERINPQYPAADFDVAAAKARMLETKPEGI